MKVINVDLNGKEIIIKKVRFPKEVQKRVARIYLEGVTK